MSNIDWLKQGDTPAFDDVIWSLPENKRAKGSFLVIGGSAQQFSSVSEAYQLLGRAGAGEIHIAVPESLSSFIPSGPTTHFIASTKTNTIARESTGQLRVLTEGKKAVLICGDVGRSSQTSHALSALMISNASLITITRDAVESFGSEPHVLLNRANTIVVLSAGQLQRLVGGKTTAALTSDMGLVLYIQTLKHMNLSADIITLHQGAVLVYSDGRISSTQWQGDAGNWRLLVASYATIVAAQHPQDRFAALTTAVYLANQAAQNSLKNT